MMPEPPFCSRRSRKAAEEQLAGISAERSSCVRTDSMGSRRVCAVFMTPLPEAARATMSVMRLAEYSLRFTGSWSIFILGKA